MAKKFSLVLGFSLLAGSLCVAASAPLAVTSPDGKLTVSIEVKSNPQPYLPGKRRAPRRLGGL